MISQGLISGKLIKSSLKAAFYIVYTNFIIYNYFSQICL